MSDKKKKNTMETTTLTKVPMEERKSWISVAFMQAGIMICVPSLLLGAILSASMPLWQALAAGIIGYLLTILISFFLGMQGADLGIPSAVITCSTFGTRNFINYYCDWSICMDRDGQAGTEHGSLL